MSPVRQEAAVKIREWLQPQNSASCSLQRPSKIYQASKHWKKSNNQIVSTIALESHC
jgi:hypothetical protein